MKFKYTLMVVGILVLLCGAGAVANEVIYVSRIQVQDDVPGFSKQYNFLKFRDGDVTCYVPVNRAGISCIRD